MHLIISTAVDSSYFCSTMWLNIVSSLNASSELFYPVIASSTLSCLYCNELWVIRAVRSTLKADFLEVPLESPTWRPSAHVKSAAWIKTTKALWLTEDHVFNWNLNLLSQVTADPFFIKTDISWTMDGKQIKYVVSRNNISSIFDFSYDSFTIDVPVCNFSLEWSGSSLCLWFANSLWSHSPFCLPVCLQT